MRKTFKNKIISYFSILIALILSLMLFGCDKTSKSEETYTINWINYDGTILETDNVKKDLIPIYNGSTPIKPSDNTYTYTFAGWDSEVTKCNSDKDYKATYTSTFIEYTVNFYDEDGTTLLKTSKYHYGDVVEEPEVPTKESNNTYTYTFAGWDSEVTKCNSDKNYKATYTPVYIEYTVNFYDEDGTTLLKSAKYHYGDTVEEPEVPTKKPTESTIYTFAGWDKEVTICTGTRVYRATYSATPRQYKVTFVDYDDSILKEKTPYDYGTSASEIVMPLNPTREKDNTYTYTFAGWKPIVENVTKDIIYKATYTPVYIEYTVNFYDEDGTTLLKSTKYHYGDVVEEPEAPTKPSDDTYTYKFTGWDSEVTNCTGDKDYKATYTSTFIEYTVNFYDEDGTTLLKTSKYHYGDVVEEPEVPTKESNNTYTYTFAGWDSEVTNCTGNKDYIATYTSTYIEYTVNFYDEDGTTLLKSTKYHYGDEIEEPETPTRKPTESTIYTFAGWDSEVTNCTGNKDYIATYTSTYIEYTVNFYDEDGTTLLKSTKYHYGDEIEEPETPTRKPTESTIYTFAGWDSEVVNCTGDKNYKATYSSTTRQYKVTFVDYDDSILKEETLYNYGTSASDIVLPLNPTKPSDNVYNYEFEGWEPSVENVTKDIIYKATYTPVYIEYTVNFYDEDGTTLLKSTKYQYGDTVEEPEAPSKLSDNTYTYTFTGWNSEVTICTGNKDYIATYTPVYIEYTVNFYDEDGTTLLKSTKYHYGDVVEEPEAPTKPSDDTYTYKFTGWDSEVTNCTGDKDYKATYSSTFIEYTVNFYNYDGTTTLKSTKYHYGDAVVEPTRTPTREKDNIYTYTFAGWNSEVTNCTGNKDYIATYTSTYIEYDVIFRDFDGMTDLKSTKYHYGDVVEEPETPTRKPTESTIYTFAGWDKEVTICTGTRVYRATYSATPRQYKVTFVDYDDSILKEETLYNYGTSASDIVLPTTPSRTSTNGKYEFIGWKPAVSNVNSDVVYKAKYETIYERNGNSIYFGKYPQSLVTDEKIINKLLFNSGYYPTESDPFQWTPYEYYYRGSINTHFMYYQDIDLDNDGINDYRGVYFSSYRPKYIYGSDSDSSQRSNGFYTKEVYWFSYDLIEWKILNENDGKLLIVTNLCLDAKEFYPSDSEYFNHNGKNGYSNNYELSEIRKILNDDFYNFAFNDLQRSLIEIAEIDNSIDSTKYCDSKYICQNTSDKIFLLSYKEADTYFTYNENRRTTATAYAKCQGLEINGGYARWWTRSPRDPYNNSKPVVIYVDHGQNTAGAVVDGGYTYYLNGVRPACWINISQLNETN